MQKRLFYISTLVACGLVTNRPPGCPAAFTNRCADHLDHRVSPLPFKLNDRGQPPQSADAALGLTSAIKRAKTCIRRSTGISQFIPAGRAG